MKARFIGARTLTPQGTFQRIYDRETKPQITILYCLQEGVESVEGVEGVEGVGWLVCSHWYTGDGLN